MILSFIRWKWPYQVQYGNNIIYFTERDPETLAILLISLIGTMRVKEVLTYNTNYNMIEKWLLQKIRPIIREIWWCATSGREGRTVFMTCASLKLTTSPKRTSLWRSASWCWRRRKIVSTWRLASVSVTTSNQP